jgi:ABC-2 type transport system ATP-binding protein
VSGHHCWRDSVQARRHISYLPGELRLYENMNGRQILRFLSDLRGGCKQEEVDTLARAFDIDLSRPLAQLSSGMKRKVALLVVLTAHAPLLILDEPTNALDPTMRRLLLDQLRRARAQGQTVLFSSHVLSEVEEVCDRVGILQRGRLVHLQAMSELQQTRRVRFRLASRERERPEIEPLPDFAGVQEVIQEKDHATIYCDGPLEPILQWLARQPVAELTVESVGLESVYAKYHGEATP